MKNKMNKKGFVLTGVLITILIIIGILILLPIFSGGLALPVLSKIPAPIWIVLGIILLFKLVGSNKK